MDTRFDTGLGTGMVALAFNTAFGTGVYHSRASALASILVLPMEGAVAFNTRLGTYKHSLRHRFRALAWQLGFALARNFAFNTALGTGVYHWRGICTGVDARAVSASTLVETLT
ncbi:hypothetical protein INT47_009513 [Mucor saturninus]|uniref:Uncharacterized protein n=1 Tax=Mucor saturninus TaxID=64648 RepID=A0A8H7R6U5_9FUNG|nr:hypothetical protein INT47_009513 [Mucor saturninus]